MRILFVCSGNKRRSPTAEDLFSTLYPDDEFRSAGTNIPMCQKEGSTPISGDLIHWADLILVMEQHHLNALYRFRSSKSKIETGVLGIPDRYEYGDRKLIDLLKRKGSKWLPQKP